MHPHQIPPRPRGLSGRAGPAGQAVPPESLPPVVLVPVHPERDSRPSLARILGWLAAILLLGGIAVAIVLYLRPSEEELRAKRARAIEQQFADKFTIRPAARPSPRPTSSPVAP